MKERYDQKYEDHIKILAEHRLERKNYKIFDYRPHVLKRQNFPELVERERFDTESGLVVISGEGDVGILTEEFERMLYGVCKKRFE
ncbi:MAG TPA: hypothetical protein VIL74_24585 [Pyrinomonadaceae bacterium]|jgi:hypothetical protein